MMKNTKLKDTSTETKFEYIVFHCVYGFSLGYWYYVLMPKFLPIVAYKGSIIKLAICMFSMCIFGVLLSFNKNRRGVGVAIDVISGLGLYTILILGKYNIKLVLCTLLGVAVITCIQTIIIMNKKVKNKKKKSE